jgi:hypothetical protein
MADQTIFANIDATLRGGFVFIGFLGSVPAHG